MRRHLGAAHFARRWAGSAWLFHSLTENLDQCVYVLDGEGRCLAANDSFCRWLKRPRSEILGRSVADLWPHPTAEREAGEHELVLRGEWIEAEEECPRGGQTSRLRMRKAPLCDTEGNVCGVLCLFREVPTEPASEPLRGQASRLELLGRLTSGVLHDLRNLLMLLGTPLSLLQTSLPAGLGTSELATLWNAVKHGTALTERLLRMARGDPGELRPIDVNESCAEVIDLLQHNIAPWIRLEARLRPGLPPVLAEAGELMQVLLNLCLNACDAMPRGGQLFLETDLGSVRRGETGGLSARRPSDFICLHVRDSGEGMSPEVRSRIFELMFTTKPVARNSGLGLAIVQDIVQRRGGWIECESTLGAGTCFTVWLPAASTQPGPTIVSTTRTLVPKTILVVEADPGILLLATTILTQRGFRVFPSEKGRQAVELYRQKQREIDLVVVPEHLAGQSGLEVMNELLAVNPHLALVLVSAAGMPAASWPARPSRLAMLNKPYTPEQLVQCVCGLLSADTRDKADRFETSTEMGGALL
jgi:two-component system, cell cycle sensor histidine kinase and response regulator CckA